MVLVQIVACVLAADFLSGLLHWMEDAYGEEDWPITGKWITQPNVLHHRDPGHMTRYRWIETVRVSLALGLGALVLCWALGVLSWQLCLVVAVLINANEVHKWAHRNPRRNPRVVTWLQRLGVLQSARHHGRHHRGTKDTHYCTVTNYLNPVLEAIDLWPRLEQLIYVIVGARRRFDPTVAMSPHVEAPRRAA